MGYQLWDLESRKILCSNDMYFNKSKFHAKPKKVEEIRRVVFREDEPNVSTSNQQSEAQIEVPVEAPIPREAESSVVRCSKRVSH